MKLAADVAAYGDGGDLRVSIVNSERRALAIERVGLATSKTQGAEFRWRLIRDKDSGGPIATRKSPLPKTLNPGDPAYRLQAPLFRVRNHFYPDPPTWLWCEDSYLNLYWEPIPKVVQAAILETKRRRRGPEDGGGHPTMIEVEDGKELRPDQPLVDWDG